MRRRDSGDGRRRRDERSLRRRSQLLAWRPDLEVRELRGNVDTRLRRLADGDYDALVLAAAGLRAARAATPASPPIRTT